MDDHENAMAVIFDPTSSLARLGGDRALFRALVQFFQEDYPALLRLIREGVAGEDIAQVERSTHALHGMVASFSAEGALTAIERVAQSAGTGDMIAAAQWLPELELEIERLRDALSEFVASLSP